GPCVPPRGENAYWSPLIERHPFLACNGVVHLPTCVTCVAGLTPLGAAAVPAEFEHALGEGGDDLRLGHVDLRVQELDLALGEQAVDGLSPGQFGLLPLGAVDAAHHGIAVECRSEEHTSELQSRENLVCRLLLEKKNKINFLQHQ